MQYQYSRVHRTMEVTAIGLFFLLAFGLGWKAVHAVSGTASALAFGVSLAAGYVLADLVSGLVHWLADRYGTERTPLLGRSFIRPFREHHVDPKGITRHDFVETNGSNCIVSIAPMALVLWLVSGTPGSIACVAGLGGMFSFSLAIFATNQIHKWAHTEIVPGFAAWLQRARLILPPEHHDIHHTSPFETHYCITTGWWNPLLARIGFFEKMERTIAACTGLRPAMAMTGI